MAFPTAVNSQITDAVTQSNVEVVGEAPAAVPEQPAQAETPEDGGEEDAKTE